MKKKIKQKLKMSKKQGFFRFSEIIWLIVMNMKMMEK